MGRRIAEARRRRGLTQVVLADAIGVVRSHLTNAERGKGALALDKLAALAKETGVSLDWLVGLIDEPEATRMSPQAEILACWSLSDDEGRKMLLRFARSVQREPPLEGPSNQAAPSGSPGRRGACVVPLKERAALK